MSKAMPVAGTAQIDSTQDHQIDLSIDQEQHDGLVRSTLMGVRGISHEDAEDAVQNAWLVLAEKAEHLEPGPVGSLNSHLELSELADDPIAARALDAAWKGASACLAPRGASHRCSHPAGQAEESRNRNDRGLDPAAGDRSNPSLL